MIPQQSLKITILNIIRESASPLSAPNLAELASTRRHKIPVPSVRRICGELVESGLVVRIRESTISRYAPVASAPVHVFFGASNEFFEPAPLKVFKVTAEGDTIYVEADSAEVITQKLGAMYVGAPEGVFAVEEIPALPEGEEFFDFMALPTEEEFGDPGRPE